jgi:hypothetical protein
MKYRMNTTGTVQTLENLAEQDNEFFIRIYFNGKFINYLFDPSDIKNLGLGTIFDMIDPDPELLEARTLYAQALDQRQEVLRTRAKKKKQHNSPA